MILLFSDWWQDNRSRWRRLAKQYTRASCQDNSSFWKSCSPTSPVPGALGKFVSFCLLADSSQDISPLSTAIYTIQSLLFLSPSFFFFFVRPFEWQDITRSGISDVDIFQLYLAWYTPNFTGYFMLVVVSFSWKLYRLELRDEKRSSFINNRFLRLLLSYW